MTCGSGMAALVLLAVLGVATLIARHVPRNAQVWHPHALDMAEKEFVPCDGNGWRKRKGASSWNPQASRFGRNRIGSSATCCFAAPRRLERIAKEDATA